MAYFIHNKYDKNSSAKVTSSGGLNYTYNDDPSVTVIDYYGNLEQGIDTYKYLDTTYMGTQVIDSLTYSTIDEGNLIGKNQTTDGNSGINYASGVLPIVEKLQELIGVASDTGGSESIGSIMAKLNAILGISNVKSIQRGTTKKTISNVKTGGNGFTNITLQTPVNLAKTFVLCYGCGIFTGIYLPSSYGQNYYKDALPYATLINENTLRVGGGSYYYEDEDTTSSKGYDSYEINVTWQVIELL